MMSKKEKTNYKNSLNLPKTSFSMKANLIHKEPDMQKIWDRENLYENIRKQSAGRNKFIFHDGPPYANGPIHLGHLLNKVLKDFVVRSKTMEGYDVDFVPGWDCHGLPIEHKVLKDLRDKAKNYTKLQIRNKCQSYASKFVKIQSKQMKRLGTIGNYNDPYMTMVSGYEVGVLEVFASLMDNGLVYRDLKPVHWSIENQTALADAELEYYERTDKSAFVLFRINQTENLPESLNASSEDTFLMIWTTTPWTLPANLAVAVSPIGNYGLYELNHKGKKVFAVLSELLAEKVLAKVGVSKFKKIGSCTGKELVESTITYDHPFAGRDGVVVSAEYVTFEDGTGLVHIAPGHGIEDYQTGLKEGLDVYCPVLADGTFDETVPDWLQGVDVWKGNQSVIDSLKQSENLFFEEEYTHSYPHDWRSKTPTIFRAAEQWFINVDKPYGKDKRTLREKAIESATNEIKFFPEWGKNRLKGMLEARPDWCISRQRSWGLPIPYFVNDEGEYLLTAKIVKLITSRIAEKGSNVWFLEDAANMLEGYDPLDDPDAPDWIKENPELVKNGLKKGTDIFDVWFESGSSWKAVLKHPDRNIGYPADLYLEGSDQHRGWFQSSLLTAIGATDIPPFKALLTHGFMVDADGKKMSKSGGNALEVDELLKNYGADICRWWVSTLKYSNDIKTDWKYFKVAADEYRKIRNTIRFLLGNTSDFDPVKDKIIFTDEDRFSIDYWVYANLSKFVLEAKKAYSEFDYKRVSELTFNFCSDTLSSVYLAAIKDRLYCDKRNSRRRRRSQTVMYEIADSLIRLLAPILVTTADEAYRCLGELRGTDEVKSVHLTEFPTIPSIELDNVWNEIFSIRNESLKELEKTKNDGVSNPLDAGIKVSFNTDFFNTDFFSIIKPYEPELADLCGVSRFNVVTITPKVIKGGHAITPKVIKGGHAITPKVISVEVYSLTTEVRCERSWKRDETVKQRADGGMLSDRDAEAIEIN